MLGLEPLGIAIFGYADIDYGSGILPDLSDMDHSGAPYAALAYDGALSHFPSFPIEGIKEKSGFLFPFEIENATITASSSSLPVENLLEMHIGFPWRSALGQRSSTLELKLNGPYACNFLGFVSPNFTGSTLIRVRGYASQEDMDSDLNVVVDTNHKSPWPLNNKPFIFKGSYHIAFIKWENEITLQYWKIDIGDGGGVDYNEISVLRIGRFWQPKTKISYDSNISFESSDLQITTDYGIVYTESRGTARILELIWTAATHEDCNKFVNEISERIGRAQDILYIHQPGDVSDKDISNIYGLVTQTGKYTPKPVWINNHWVWNVTLTLKQLL